MAVLHGSLSGNGALGGSLTEESTLSGIIAKQRGGLPYSGEYEVTPSGIIQTLETSGRILDDDIVVNPIGLPYADVSAVTAVAPAVISGYKFVDKNGILKTGNYNPPASAWSQASFTNHGTSAPVIVTTESTSSYTFEVPNFSLVYIANRVLFVRVTVGIASASAYQFIASDSILLPGNTIGTISASSVMIRKYNASTTKTIQTYNNSSSAYGVFVYSFIPSTAGSENILTIRSRGSSTHVVKGSYSIQMWALTMPSGTPTLPNI